MLRIIFLHIFFYTVFLDLSSVKAQPTVVIRDEYSLYPLNYDKICVLKNNTNYPTSIQEALQVADKFENMASSCYTMVSNETTWLRFSIDNQTVNAAYIVFYPTIPDSVSLFKLHADGSFEMAESGALLPFRKRGILSPNLNLQLTAAQGQPQIYYLRIKAAFADGGKLYVGSAPAVLYRFHFEDGFNGLFFGILILIICLNIFMYFVQKDIIYVWYALDLLCYSIMLGLQNGFFHETLFPDTPQYNQMTFFFLACIVIFGNLFTIFFTNTSKNTKYIHNGIVFIVTSAILSIIIGLAGYKLLSTTITLILAIPSALLGVSASIIHIRKGFKSTWFYLSGWVCTQITLTIYTLDSKGIFFDLQNIKYVVYMGIVSEALFLTSAIFKRIADIRREKEAAIRLAFNTIQEKQILISEQNQVLEQSVHERTKDLQEALKREQLIEKQINEYAQKLEISNKELTEFAYLVSHDLKSPLRNIASFTDLLIRKNKDKFDKRDQDFMNFIVKGAKQSMQLVEDLLNFAKIDKDLGKPKVFCLTEIIENVQFNLSNLIEEKKATIVCENTLNLMGHIALLSQLFQNLIANGIKYNQSESPIIEIGVTKNELNNPIFWVRDNGIGIAPKFKEDVFKMFRRLHTHEQYEGSGIGLAFCKKIVETYGGKIWLESEENKGSTFFFTLPKTMQL